MGNTVRVISKTRNIEENLGKILNEQRKQGKYCDFKLKTEQGDEFPIHKVILESVSEFFNKLFNSQFEDSRNSEFIVRNCSSAILKKIIEFIYTNEVELSSTTIREILDVASFLQITNLVRICLQYFIDNCNKENCFDLLHFTESVDYGEKALLKELAQKCIKVIHENLIELMRNRLKEFNELSFESFYNLLKYKNDDNYGSTTSIRSTNSQILMKNYNKEFYIIVINWIQYDLEVRQKYFIALLRKINFDKIDIDYRLNTILNEQKNPLIKHEKFLTQMMLLLKKKWEQEKSPKTGNNKNQSCNTEARNNRNNFVLLSRLLNLHAIMGNEIISYDFNKDQFTQTITKIINKPRKFAYSVHHQNNQLYITGGRNMIGIKKSKLHYYNPHANFWAKLPDMRRPRSGHSSCILNDRLYICGGLNDKILEIYDISGAFWSASHQEFQKQINTIGLCTLDKCIYAINYQIFQSYDPRVGHWRSLRLIEENNQQHLKPYLKTLLDYKMKAIAYNNFVYRFDYYGVDTYDVRINRWLSRKTFPNNANLLLNHNFELCLLNDKIYMLTTSKNNLNPFNSYEYVLHKFNASNLSLHDYRYVTSKVNEYNWGFFSTN